MGAEPLETMEGQDWPTCRQLSVFLENRLGQLLRVTRLLEDEPISILGMAVDASVDCAVVRLLVNDPDAAVLALRDAGFAVSESELLVVELPPGKRGIMTLCTALITGEVNINYVYSVWAAGGGRPCLAVQVDDIPAAAHVLAKGKFIVVRQSEL